MFMEGIERHGRPTQSENTRPSDQRDIVKVDDVKVTIEYGSQLSGFESRLTCLLGNHWRQHPKSAPQAMNHNPIMFSLHRRFFALKGVGIFAMHDLDLMALRYQRASQRSHERGIATEVIGGIKRRDHAEAHKSTRYVRLFVVASLHITGSDGFVVLLSSEPEHDFATTSVSVTLAVSAGWAARKSARGW